MVRSESVDYFSFFEAFEGTGHYLLLCWRRLLLLRSVPHENHVIHPKIVHPPSPSTPKSSTLPPPPPPLGNK